MKKIALVLCIFLFLENIVFCQDTINIVSKKWYVNDTVLLSDSTMDSNRILYKYRFTKIGIDESLIFKKILNDIPIKTISFIDNSALQSINIYVKAFGIKNNSNLTIDVNVSRIVAKIFLSYFDRFSEEELIRKKDEITNYENQVEFKNKIKIQILEYENKENIIRQNSLILR